MEQTIIEWIFTHTEKEINLDLSVGSDSYVNHIIVLMPCTACGEAGHNIRSCPWRTSDGLGLAPLRDDALAKVQKHLLPAFGISVDEKFKKRGRKPTTCSVCSQTGHNKRSCLHVAALPCTNGAEAGTLFDSFPPVGKSGSAPSSASAAKRSLGDVRYILPPKYMKIFISSCCTPVMQFVFLSWLADPWIDR